MNRRLACTALLAAPLLTGCVYYNTMWSAERSARQARRAEARGDEGGARIAWGRAAAKAESVHVKHPGSKWADDAWVLHAEGAARGGSCAEARSVIGSALAEAVSDELQERVALVAAECALALGAPVEAARQLGPALTSPDAGRRSKASYLAGRAAEARGDVAGALNWYARSRERAAGPARVQALLAADSTNAALALMDTVARGRFVETEWNGMLRAVSARAGPAAATDALDRMLRRARVPTAERTRLLLADADRRYAAGQFEEAVERYGTVIRTGGDGPEVRTARVRLIRADAAGATGEADIARLQFDLDRLTSDQGGGSPEAVALTEVLAAVVSQSPSDAIAFRAAELARDSLRAPALAAHLFLALAAEYPTSLFAPKALIAALPLLPAQHDSLLSVLEGTYGGSPYVRALANEISPAYAALEDSLGRALGITVLALGGRTDGGVRAPVPGPPGPWWDDVFRAVEHAAVLDTVAAGVNDGVRQGRERQPADLRRPQAQPRRTERRPDP